MKRRNERPRGKRGAGWLRSGWLVSQWRGSIFAKYFIACVAVILLSFLFLATALVLASVNYSNNQKRALYLKDAQTLAGTVEWIHEQYSGNELINYYAKQVAILADASVIVTDPEGNPVVIYVLSPRANSDIANPDSPKIPASVMAAVKKSESVYDVSTLGGFFSRSYMTQGVRITDKYGNINGAVFIASPASDLIGYIADIFRIFVVCLAAVMVFAFAAIYFITLRMVRPLRQMSSAAMSFAKGDFSIRVPVGDNDEIGRLAVAFNNMAASLTSLEAMRRNFVANVSHELKTPMTSIAGFIDGILDGTIPPEKQSYYLKQVSEEVKRLSRLVRSFLDIARIEAGEMKITPVQFDVEETIRRVIVGFEYAIDGKQLTVKGLDEDADRRVPVLADADLTHQIIYNLVDNAVKFANPGGTLEITVAEHDQRVYVGVKNTGMGIPAGELPYVFDRFYKTDKSRSLDRKGVGLGLYIVKTVLNKQGEDITVKSVEGEYCEFVFTLRAGEPGT